MPTPDRTSLDAIVTAGRDILESNGPAGLTMQAVAVRVGVKAPSLYKRVKDRNALLRLVADATVDDLAARLTGSGGLPELARTFRAFARERPEAFRVMFSGDASPDALARVSAPVLRLAGELVGEHDALSAARLITAWASGFITMELAGAFQLGGSIDEAFEFGLERLARALSTS
ncbi:TetR/AcrR family transcriptional regulator [Compostimonas suwonensis]|uniref:Regulatory TetR family protein n=1 Tax=Compostimonas suwonensis TaxID=1048394 RepID=A0A2M9BB99_9MICO|nr:TetR/AcrR family transcriptional regulator [Compostimonas suwonensis]PJJ55222.1 regulatory TetR family protein [Compostimonas suwonensis]